MKKNIQNIKASVRALLDNKARELNHPFGEVLQYYGIERFLYRLSRSQYGDKFILKGALLFSVWNLPERRTTLDIDLLAHYDNQVKSIEGVIREVCNVTAVSDGLIFDESTVKGYKIKEDADYEGVRVKFTGFLDRSRIPMQIDIGFGDIVYPQPKRMDYPVILDFEAFNLKSYPSESVVSEKFEAMIKLGALNSRMKDFYDVWLMLHRFNFDGKNLSEALKRTFEHRKTVLPIKTSLFAEEIYNKKSDRQMLWKAFLTKNDIKLAPDFLAESAREIERFLVKPISAIYQGIVFQQKWNPMQGWVEK